MNIELPRRDLDLASAIAEADIRCLHLTRV
jgi:hypothetical protein